MKALLGKLISLSLAACLMAIAPPVEADGPPAGKIRVMLDAQGENTQAEIGVYGAYLLDGALSFQRGVRLKITAHADALMVYYEGLVYRAGNTLSLVRYAAENGTENGLRLNGSLNLLEGDLHISLQDGLMRLVLSIGIEDYLKGVVPYEMSDSFPLEALKAQAVAARSYALRSIRADRDFDVYDNANDQVYRGLNTENKRALKAIVSTDGMGLVYRGELAQSYYTASNGGQVETAFNAWGREKLPYSQLTADPYDLENPASEKRAYTVPKVWSDGSQNIEPLRRLLTDALTAELDAKGYDTDPSHIRIDGIAGIRAVSPRFGDASLLMTGLAFDVLLSARKPYASGVEDEAVLFSVATPSPQPQTAQIPAQVWGPMEKLSVPLTAELSIFPDIEQTLGLSINLKDNEIISVIQEENSYILQSGRYGHGVGLSQRGAEWMAKAYAWTYEQILNFYYPGTQLKRFVTVPAANPLLMPAFLTTPGPRPTATPRPTLIPLSMTAAPDQWVAQVSGVAKDSSLNLRDAPQLTGKILYQLLYGQRMIVLGQEQEGWLRVRVDGLDGYVMASYIEKVK